MSIIIILIGIQKLHAIAVGIHGVVVDVVAALSLMVRASCTGVVLSRTTRHQHYDQQRQYVDDFPHYYPYQKQP